MWLYILAIEGDTRGEFPSTQRYPPPPLPLPIAGAVCGLLFLLGLGPNPWHSHKVPTTSLESGLIEIKALRAQVSVPQRRGDQQQQSPVKQHGTAQPQGPYKQDHAFERDRCPLTHIYRPNGQHTRLCFKKPLFQENTYNSVSVPPAIERLQSVSALFFSHRYTFHGTHFHKLVDAKWRKPHKHTHRLTSCHWSAG